MAGIKETFSKGFTTLNVKTNNFVEETKIKTYINTLENEIAGLKARAGEQLYQQWVNQQIQLDQIEPIFQAVSDKYKEIEAQKQKITAMQAEADQILGKKESAPAAGNSVFCSSCGAPNAPTNKFCIKCGSPIQ